MCYMLYGHSASRDSLVAQMVKSLPAIRETRVWSLSREDPLKKEMATHPSILAWKIPWTEEPGGLQSTGLQRVRQDWAISLSLSYTIWTLSFHEEFQPVSKTLRNLYAGQEATVRTGHGTTDWFQIGKGVRQGCILSPCLFNFYAE